jgi:hypothetical protein
MTTLACRYNITWVEWVALRGAYVMLYDGVRTSIKQHQHPLEGTVVQHCKTGEHYEVFLLDRAGERCGLVPCSELPATVHDYDERG